MSPALLLVSAQAAGSTVRARLRGDHGDRTAGQGSGRQGGRPDGAIAGLLYRGVRFYQAEVSALTPTCPHTPCCSQYAASALQRHGALRGSWLTVRRLFRCRPGTAGGYDPVPA